MSKRATIDILRAARARIEDPKHWCQQMEAVDAEGNTTRVYSETAIRWCAMGTLYAEGYAEEALDMLYVAAEELGHSGPADLNDDTDHTTVMRMYDKAILFAEDAAAPPVAGAALTASSDSEARLVEASPPERAADADPSLRPEPDGASYPPAGAAEGGQADAD